MSWQADIGLEVHVQLRTRSKMFCGCPNAFGAEPNTQVCPVCLGYPGALPVINEEAIRLTVRSGLLLDSRINLHSKFDRKNYFYPDQAKNYQISQYDEPLCVGGHLDIAVDGRPLRVGLTRIHLEEDVAKNIHFDVSSGVDFNRAGTPLMEIVTEPDLHTPEETLAFLQALKQVLQYGEISDCNLEQGNIRCDINCSVRRSATDPLGTKIEIKNMNTFRGVFRALQYEIPRQIRELERGRPIVQETRRWDDAGGRTDSMRGKEDAHDYRYFPEPDLPPVQLTAAAVEAWRASLPELPAARRARLVTGHGLPEYDAGVLVADRDVADFFEETVAAGAVAKSASNWIMTELLARVAESGASIRSLRVTPATLAALLKLVEARTINGTTAKDVLGVLLAEGGDPREIVQQRGLAQVSDTGAIEAFVAQAAAANEKSVTDYRAGKQAAFEFLVGQVMRLSKGKANPQLARELLKKQLG
ncbi:MAG TPA: Asp-tRNA(Asn)/Glu-tRNA(Gln) amidotransferase subunit GatB [Kiritimatiellia bacterium]|nr:Asp-tRNA(Asn)/Glu-tRNA(Gln) amidotransferase subunit GatB [Kiritimatiellia bacterium]